MQEGHSLTPEELSELLDMISRAIKRESSITIYEIERFTRRALQDRGSDMRMRDIEKYRIGDILSLFRRFKTVESLRLFLQIGLGVSVPYRMSKKNLVKLGIGAFIMSNISPEEAELRWNKRESKLNSINLYKMSKKQLVDTFEDNFLFPDGYAIVSFVKRFKIKLPQIKSKSKLIQHLLTKLYERPRTSEEIGYYGVDRRRKRPDDLR